MPQTPHIERHFTAGEVVRDVVIGMSDGLTVPFALAAGLSGAVENSHIIVIAGLAEIAAGSIAMGLGGYLAAKGDAEHYASERQREVREVEEIPEEEAREIQNVFSDYGLSHEESGPVVQALTRRPKEWVDFMMRFELGLEEPDPKRRARRVPRPSRPPTSPEESFRFRPTWPCTARATALLWSVMVTLLALAVFGYIKGRFTGAGARRSASQTIVIGGLAAGAAFLLAKLIS